MKSEVAPAAGRPTMILAFVTLVVALVYAVLFASYCCLDTAPLPWDEAYFLEYPSKLRIAFEDGGFFGLIKAFFGTRYFKPPLSMIGTTPAVFLAAADPLAMRIDNLLVTLAAAACFYAFVRRRAGAWIALALATAFATAPFVQMLARTELAEVYLIATSVLYLCILLAGDDFRSRRRSVLLGCSFALGLSSKMSFPLIALAPSLWIFARAMRDGRRRGDIKPRLANFAYCVLGFLVLALPLLARNWKHMWRHLRAQYGWVGREYSAGAHLSLDYLAQYLGAWAEYLGALWIGLGILLVFLLIRSLLLPGKERPCVSRRVAGPLAATALVNFVYCYFFPVFDPRFSIGTFVALQMLIGLGLASAVKDHAKWLPAGVISISLFYLLSNSYLDPKAAVLGNGLPFFGTQRQLLPAPDNAADLRDAVLEQLVPQSARPTRVALVGDHQHLNIDNLRLRVLERRLQVEFEQLAYLGPDLTVKERVRRAAAAQSWLVILPPDADQSAVWTTRIAAPLAKFLDARPDLFRRSKWTAQLRDASRVLCYARIATAAQLRALR